jgi:hypothetical protein
VPGSIPVDLACLRTIVVCDVHPDSERSIGGDAVKLVLSTTPGYVIGEGIRW